MLPTTIPPIAPGPISSPELCGSGAAVGPPDTLDDACEIGVDVTDDWLVPLFAVSLAPEEIMVLLVLELAALETPLKTPMNCLANRGFLLNLADRTKVDGQPRKPHASMSQHPINVGWF